MQNVALIAVVLLVIFGEHIVAGLKSAYAFVAARLPSVSGGFSGILEAKLEIKAWKAVVLAALFLATSGRLTLPTWPTDWKLPSFPSIIAPAPAKVDRVTYIFEKNDGGIPSGVTAAIGALNARDIMATTYEVPKEGEAVPEQYKVALAEAKAQGVPLAVAQAGEKVVRTVKAPTTSQQLLEVVP